MHSERAAGVSSGHSRAQGRRPKPQGAASRTQDSMNDKRQKNQLQKIWKQWKRSTVRYVRLRQRNIRPALAAQTAGRPHGPWRLAHRPALQSPLPIAYFDALGLPRLRDVL